MSQTLNQLLQDSNKNKMQVMDIADVPIDLLIQNRNKETWSSIEIIAHLNKVYDIYLPNFRKALEEIPDLQKGEEALYKSSLLGRLAIYSSKPKGSKRRFKMKTFDFFQPELKTRHEMEAFDAFYKNKDAFNGLIKQAKAKNVSTVKMPTALGDKYRLFIPECFAFILAHESRHLIQIHELLKQLR